MTDEAASRPQHPDRLRRTWRWLALAWLCVVLAVGWHQWRFWQQPAIDSDVLALLPRSADDALLSDAIARIADASARQVVVALGAGNADDVRRAETAYREALGDAGALLSEAGTAADWYDAAQSFYAPYRDRLLTPEQREALSQSSVEQLSERALAALYGLPGAPRMLPWHQDPLGLWPQWWQARAEGSGMRIGADGLLQSGDHTWTVLQFDSVQSAFRLDGERRLQDVLDAAGAAARDAVPGVRELRAGVPLHAEAAAVQANREINTIGWGSLFAVLLLAWLAFRSPRPILLVATSLLIGCATALTVTLLLFGQVHLLTLVFGASLVGVAEDYGIHWFACRQSDPKTRPWPMLRHLFPALSLALVTSVAAYLALGLAPFPGLRQMAVFSVVGLTAAFLTVVCWFPWLDRNLVRDNAFSRALGASLSRWPRVDRRRGWWILATAAVVFVVAGLVQLRPQDDLRSLQSSPPELIAQQRELGELLGMPSPAQFFLVQGDTADAVLRHEEALTARLRGLEAEDVIGGHRAISDWLPSRERQAADAALAARVETGVVASVSAALGEPLQRGGFDTPMPEADAWLADPVSQPLRTLWLGALGDGVASVVMVDGVSRDGALPALHAAAQGLPGVRWVDRTADYSMLLGHYRRMMSWLLLAGMVLVAGVLAWRYRRDAWRTVVPTMLAGALALALLGWLGQPLQLFNVLALLLLLGMGIDYGIFLTEHRGDPGAWLAVCVGGASTWLSFGLLSLSSTPALRAFGLTLLFGIGLVWLLSPLFRPPVAASTERT